MIKTKQYNFNIESSKGKKLTIEDIYKITEHIYIELTKLANIIETLKRQF